MLEDADADGPKMQTISLARALESTVHGCSNRPIPRKCEIGAQSSFSTIRVKAIPSGVEGGEPDFRLTSVQVHPGSVEGTSQGPKFEGGALRSEVWRAVPRHLPGRPAYLNQCPGVDVHHIPKPVGSWRIRSGSLDDLPRGQHCPHHQGRHQSPEKSLSCSSSQRQRHEPPLMQHETLGLQVHKECLPWGLKYKNRTYVEPFGTPGQEFESPLENMAFDIVLGFADRQREGLKL